MHTIQPYNILLLSASTSRHHLYICAWLCHTITAWRLFRSHSHSDFSNSVYSHSFTSSHGILFTLMLLLPGLTLLSWLWMSLFIPPCLDTLCSLNFAPPRVSVFFFGYHEIGLATIIRYKLT